MLAQNFKTADDLKICEAEHRGLLHVLGRLERGELRHLPDHNDSASGDCFNMGTEVASSSCGTVACIGGWVAMHMGMSDAKHIARYVAQYMEGGALYPLYWWKISGDVTPSQAAIAVRCFMTTGEPRWADALADVS